MCTEYSVYVYILLCRMDSRQGGDARSDAGRWLPVSTRLTLIDNMGGNAAEPSTVHRMKVIILTPNALRSYGNGTRRGTGPP